MSSTIPNKPKQVPGPFLSLAQVEVLPLSSYRAFKCSCGFGRSLSLCLCQTKMAWNNEWAIFSIKITEMMEKRTKMVEGKCDWCLKVQKRIKFHDHGWTKFAAYPMSKTVLLSKNHHHHHHHHHHNNNNNNTSNNNNNNKMRDHHFGEVTWLHNPWKLAPKSWCY